MPFFALLALAGCNGADCSDACPDGTRRASFDETLAASGQQFYVYQTCETLCETIQPCVPPNIPTVTADAYRCAPLEGFADIPPADDIDFSFVDDWAALTDAPPDLYDVEQPHLVVALNADGDGAPDIAYLGDLGVAVMRNDGSGGLLGPGDAAPSGFHRQLFAVDIDGDGLDDLVYNDGIDFALAYSDGSGNLTGATTVPGGIGNGGIAADIDQDGFADLVYAPRAAAAEVAYGRGDGSFSAGVALPVADLNAAVVASWGYECSSSTSIAAGDLDGDGDTDIAVFCYDRVGLMLSSGGRAWQAGGVDTLPVNEADMQVSLGDVTGDGRADLLYHSDAALTVQPGLGSGFGDPVEATDGCAPSYLLRAPTLTDLDGDGDLDAGVAGAGCGLASFYLFDSGQPPDAAFERIIDGEASDSVAADLDGDGLAEIIVADAANSLLHVVYQ